MIHITYRKGTTSMFWRYCKIVQHCQGNQGRWRKCSFLKWGWYVPRKCLVQSVQMESDRPIHKLFEFYSVCKYIKKKQVWFNSIIKRCKIKEWIYVCCIIDCSLPEIMSLMTRYLDFRHSLKISHILWCVQTVISEAILSFKI